ncbi:MAG: DNA-binding protein [Rhodoferax sp.]|nr:DNA-binding protein [Rhodoferax sp.]
MARAGIYKSEVVRARDRLLAMGRYPSIDAVRVELGDTGSKATIHRYLKEIEEEQGGATGTKVAVSEAIQDLVGRLASQLHEEAQAQVSDLSDKHIAKVQQLNDFIATLKSEADSARAVREQTQLTLAAEQQANARTAAELRDILLDRTKLAQEVNDLRDRLAKEEEHRQSLEDKHKQARESLEHFRQSAKEQREQEHRKHDQEVQYLRSELRNVNQALTQKQQEATHAHQECTRLLGELAHAQAGLHAALEDARGLKEQSGSLAHAQKKADEFGKQLVHLQESVKELEESKAQVQVLAERLASDKQSLELELATARATLETQKVITEAILRRLDGGDSDQTRQNVEPPRQLPFAETKVPKNHSKT